MKRCFERNGKTYCEDSKKKIIIGVVVAIIAVGALYFLYNMNKNNHVTTNPIVSQLNCNELSVQIRPAALNMGIPVGVNFCLFSNKDIQADMTVVLKNGGQFKDAMYLHAGDCTLKQITSYDCTQIAQIKLTPRDCTTKEVAVGTDQVVCGTPMLY